jgi:carbamate kinase
VFDAVTV